MKILISLVDSACRSMNIETTMKPIATTTISIVRDFILSAQSSETRLERCSTKTCVNKLEEERSCMINTRLCQVCFARVTGAQRIDNFDINKII